MRAWQLWRSSQNWRLTKAGGAENSDGVPHPSVLRVRVLTLLALKFSSHSGCTYAKLRRRSTLNIRYSIPNFDYSLQFILPPRQSHATVLHA
jgi:hypothetical protein